MTEGIFLLVIFGMYIVVCGEIYVTATGFLATARKDFYRILMAVGLFLFVNYHLLKLSFSLFNVGQ